jgi:hypothetical protein
MSGPAVLLDGTSRFNPHCILTPISSWEAEHLIWLKGKEELILIGGVFRSNIAELLPKYFQQGIDLSGAKLPKTPLKNKIVGLLIGIITSN